MQENANLKEQVEAFSAKDKVLVSSTPKVLVSFGTTYLNEQEKQLRLLALEEKLCEVERKGEEEEKAHKASLKKNEQVSPSPWQYSLLPKPSLVCSLTIRQSWRC
jgi:hypothetical protein